MCGAIAVIVIGVIETVTGAKKQTGNREDTSENEQYEFYVHQSLSLMLKGFIAEFTRQPRKMVANNI
jgi:hypothetical protein